MKLVGNTQFIAGSRETLPALYVLLEENGIIAAGNPDVYVREYTHFGIEEARELRARASARPVRGARRVFIIVTPTITAEAQNALLKTIEEAPADALFIFIVPTPLTLLTTVRSRGQVLSLSSTHTGTVLDAKAFLKALPAARIQMLSPLLEKNDEDRRDIGALIAFLSSLEHIVGGNINARTKEGVEAIYRARKYITDKGALVKPLLENVALLVPVI